MKKNIFILCIVALLSTTACLKTNETFTIQTEATFNIASSSTVVQNLNVSSGEINTNITSQTQGHQSRPSWLSTVKPSSLYLTLEGNATQLFGFLSVVKIYISANGQPEKLIAEIPSIANGINPIQILDVKKDEELVNYLKKDKVSFRLESTTDEAIANPCSIKVTLFYKVTGKSMMH